VDKVGSDLFIMKAEAESHDCWESDYARDFVASIHNKLACVTCKDPCAPIYRAKRCHHCYRLDLNLRNLEKKLERSEIEGTISFQDGVELKIAKAKIRDAEREGSRYGDISSKNLDGIVLEYEFAFLSKCLLGKNLFHGDAGLFDYSLTEGQKQFVFYMLSQISRVYKKRRRRQNVYGDALREHYSDSRNAGVRL
jgi:hypothetical protein